MSQHNYPYLRCAHTVTPTYSPVHDDHQILVIDEIASKVANQLILVNMSVCILDSYHIPILRFSSLNCLSIHVGHRYSRFVHSVISL
jgi:hypothetical protein